MMSTHEGSGTMGKRWVVLNCAVTQVLGRYETRCEAEDAAQVFGNCSFPHLLSDVELATMDEGARA